jgi:hypothetical protein
MLTIAHQLSLRDTNDRWCCWPGLKRPGYHEVPLRGKVARTAMIHLRVIDRPSLNVRSPVDAIS